MKAQKLYTFILLNLLIGCAVSRQISQEEPNQSQGNIDKSNPQYQRAKDLDAFLSGALNDEISERLDKTCKQAAPTDFYCFIIKERPQLEEEVSGIKRRGRERRPIVKTVFPKFRNNKLQNWMDLRFSSVAGLIRGVPTVGERQLEKLKTLALEEKDCPNNAAIAVAATLEDSLPNPALLRDIAALYEKGAACTSGASDQEVLWTRAGLFYYWVKDYAKAAKVLDQATKLTGVYTGRSLYWLAKALAKTKQDGEASELFSVLYDRYPFSFHSLVAAFGNSTDPGKILEKSTEMGRRRSEKKPTVNHLVDASELLRANGFTKSASRLLDWAALVSEGAEPEVRVYIAELKKDEGDYRGKITLLSDVLYNNPSLISRQTMELYFPKVFFPIFESQSQGLDPYLLLAIARRESAFNPKAVSHAKAKGLMQVMPATGRLVHKDPNLLDPETNVLVGSKYLTELLSRVGGQIHLALGAYNAGPERLDTWLQRYTTDDPILFIDLIPYRETREYVASVLRNYYWYRRIHDKNTDGFAEKLLGKS